VSQTVFFFNRFIFAYFLTPIPIMPDKKKPPTKLGVKMQNTQITTKVKEATDRIMNKPNCPRCGVKSATFEL
jgi:hypothetical protein